MQINIPQDIEALAKSRAAAHGCTSVEHYVRNLIIRDQVEHAIEEELSEEELASSLAMIDRSMEDVKAGRTAPAKEALKGIASDLGLKLDR